MAVCKVCGLEMLTADGCTVEFMYANGKQYRRIPMGAKGDHYFGINRNTRCGDCGVKMGNYHHWGCDCENCPACGHQLLSCRCKDVYVEGEAE